MDTPYYLKRARLEELRAPRPVEGLFDGLYAVGSVSGLARPTVAIVGTRAATPYGKRVARTFGAVLGRAGCCIISGLAVGIDAAAHEGALEAAAPTIGVLGGGHACFFPQRNRELAEQMIATGGAVLSPFPPEHAAHPPQFLQRNGIVAALADAVVVIEAPIRSGALNTATWAAGRIPVLAVPGDIDRPHVQGCLALIRDGATLARNAEDVLETLRVLPLPIVKPARTQLSRRRKRHSPAPFELHVTPLPLTYLKSQRALAEAVLSRLTEGECDTETLAYQLHSDISELLTVITMLEMDGLIESRGGNRYARIFTAPPGSTEF